MKDYSLYYSVYDSLSKDHKKYDRYYHKLIEDVSDDQNSNKD
jgi:hypothetical protein